MVVVVMGQVQRQRLDTRRRLASPAHSPVNVNVYDRLGRNSLYNTFAAMSLPGLGARGAH